MISHKSFKLAIDDKNKEIEKLNNACDYMSKRLAHLERQNENIFRDLFGVPVSVFEIIEAGHKVRVKTKDGKALIFEIKLIGRAEE